MKPKDNGERGQRLGELQLAHLRPEGLQSLDGRSDEFREFVDRFRDLNESIRTLFVDVFLPGRVRRCRELKRVSSLLL